MASDMSRKSTYLIRGFNYGSRSRAQGSLLMELLVVCLLISLFLPFLVRTISRLQDRHLLAQTYQDQRTFKAAIDAHFQSQWARLIPASCTDDASLSLTIQSGASVPNRLSSRIVSVDSDWLKGVDYGSCRIGMTVASNPFDVTLDCHWKNGDRAVFSSCDAYSMGQVTALSGNKRTIQLDNANVIGLSGMLESEDGFYWYLSPGKNGGTAFWRTPEESGNSLELLNGIERLSIFPLLDSDDNGSVDTLETSYGDFSLKQIRGLWIEYQYRLDDCKSERGIELDQSYESMRGDTWHYSTPCQSVGNQIISLK